MADVRQLTTRKTYEDEVDRVLKDAVGIVLKVVTDNNDRRPTGPMIPLLVYASVFQLYVEHNRRKTYETDKDFDDACAYVYGMVKDKFPLLDD